MAHWLELPRVEAPAPGSRDETISLSISDVFLNANSNAKRRTPIFQAWAHIVGQLPPINNVGKLASSTVSPTLCTLDDAVACFQGVNRPYVDEADGASVLIYVLNPLVSISYEPSMLCLAKAVRVPKSTVLTVQVKMVDSLREPVVGVSGVVTRLEFVSSSADHPTLPKGFEKRYARSLWQI